MNQHRRNGILLHWPTLLPVLTASIITIYVLNERQEFSLDLILEFTALCTIVVVLRWLFMCVLSTTWAPMKWVVFLVLVCLGIFWPAWTQWIMGKDLQGAWPMEIRCLLIMRNISLLLAVFPGYTRNSGLAVLISGFLVIACSGMADHPLLPWLSGIYVSTICFWMIDRQRSRSATPKTEVKSMLGYVGATAIIISVCIAGFNLIDSQAERMKFVQWLASSGGWLGYHESSMFGYGEEADPFSSGLNAESTGPTNNNVFLESNLPTLYDAQVEAYGEAIKKSHYRAIPIFPELNTQKEKKAVSDTQKKSGTFSTLRKQDRKQSSNRDTSAQAMLFVRGPSPAYIPLTYYNAYDGLNWYPMEDQTPHDELLQMQEDNWIHRPGERDPADPYPTVKYQVSVGNIDLTHLPLPYHSVDFRIGVIDRVSFFNAYDNGLVEMIRPIPRGTLIESRHAQFSRRISSVTPVRTALLTNYPNQSYEHDYHDLIDLARNWCKDSPEGWPEVDAIVERLRGQCTLDRTINPTNTPDPIRQFLFETNRGPDFLFASSAVMLLRVLGYETRLASGFYVTPESYDHRLKEHLIQAKDLHVWAEILVDKGRWVPIEPSPGYLLPKPKKSTWDILLNAGMGLWNWMWSHIWTTSLMLILLWISWIYRITLLDSLYTASWRLRHYLLGPNIYDTVRLLERRAALAKVPRLTNQTFGCWFESLETDKKLGPTLSHFVKHLEKSTYARPSDHYRTTRSEMKHMCSSVQRYWITSRFKILYKRLRTP